ncbi:helix-turn-helix domain-containing protein [Ruminococcus sp.]
MEYQLFPDIKLIIGRRDNSSVVNATEVSFCISGICEYSVEQKYYYLKAENCIVLQNGCDTDISYSSDYRGITLLIDSQFKSTAYSDILDMQDIMRKMSHSERCIFSADEKTEKLFVDIYKEQGDSKAAILRIKVLELLMLLSEQKTAHYEQHELIEQVGTFICRNVSDHYTISELSEMFCINPTTLKEHFRQTFGCPLYAYAKNRRMFHAAELMTSSDMRIIDIAEEAGYCNASKFSSAFREVMGVNPKYYQMEHKKIRT